MIEYPWYEIVTNSSELSQGDFIENCPIIIPPATIQLYSENEIQVVEINSIVLSQSCDLVNGKIEIVLVCPYMTLSEYLDNMPNQPLNKKSKEKAIESLKKGYHAGYHLLNKPDINDLNDYVVVDFRNVYGIHIEALKRIAEEKDSRIRLLPPYREHLSQSFARYFMRVGLPQDLEIDY